MRTASTASVLRERFAGPDIVTAPGAYDALTAKLIQAAGFPAVYMTGYGTAAAHGHADTGILGLEEMSANAARICAAVSIPVIADADTGYEDVSQTIQRYEAAGVAGIQLEDQTWPKKCGHMDGKSLIPKAEMVTKIEQAILARGDPDLIVVARTDAIAVDGFDSALERASAYAEAGADVLFVEAPTTLDQVESIPRELPGTPHFFNVAPRSPVLSRKALQELGYALVIYPGVCVTATMMACQESLRSLHATGEQTNLKDWAENFDAWNQFLGES